MIRIRGIGAAILAAPIFFALGILPARAGQLEEVGLGVLFDIATDPGDFLFDIHLTGQDRAPLPMGKAFQIGIPLVPALLPSGEIGFVAKGRVKREHGGWPQIDLYGGYWNSLVTMLLSSDDWDGGLYGYNVGLTVSTSVDSRMRLFAGYGFTQMRAKYEDKSPGVAVSLTTTGTVADFGEFQDSLSSINAARTEHFLTVGAELLRKPGKRLVAELGYGLVSDKIMFRLTWSGPIFDTGLTFYPEGAWVLWPFWNFQVRF